jgi:hypothetical protein
MGSVPVAAKVAPLPRPIGRRLAGHRGVPSFAFAALVLALVFGAVFALRIPGLGLYIDDWDKVSIGLHTPFSQQLTSWPMDYRPFDPLPWIAVTHLFGTHLSGYYAVLFAIEYVASVLLFMVVRTITRSVPLALSCAVVWALSPADPSVFWLTTYPFRLGAMFLLAAFALLLDATPLRGRTAYGCAWLGLVLSIASNELFLGLAAILACVPLLRHRDSSLTHRAMASLPFVFVIASYVGYRLYLGPKLWHLFDYKSGQMSLAPLHAARGLLQGIIVQVFGGWSAAAATVTGGETNTVLLIAAGIATWCVLLALSLLGLTYRRHRALPVRLRPGAVSMGLGMAGIVFGYIPLLFTSQLPTVGEIDSRINAASTAGGSLFVVGVIWVLVQGIGASPRRMMALFFTIIAVLIGLAAAREEAVATTYSHAWSAQQRFLRTALHLAGSASRGTTIVMIAPKTSVWDTLTGLPPVGWDSIVSFVYGGSSEQGLLMLRPDLSACAVLAGHAPGGAPLVRVGPKGLYTPALGGSATETKVAVIRYVPRTPPSLVAVQGWVWLSGGRCSIRSDWAHGSGSLLASSWLSVATGVR